MEGQSGFWNRPRPDPEKIKADNFIKEFQRLLKCFKDLQDTKDASPAAWDRAHEAASLLVHESLYDNHSFRLKITVAEGSYAETSKDYEPLDKDVREFEAAKFLGFGYVNKDGEQRFRALFNELKDTPDSSVYCSVFGFDMSIEPEFAS